MSERLERLRVVCLYTGTGELCLWWKNGGVNKLVERVAFIHSMVVKMRS